jgi:hypothetical protein
MPTLAPEHVDQQLVDLRRGLDLDGWENPAGTLFAHTFREHEITMTGDTYTINPATNVFSAIYEECPLQPCCMM